jgi:hypothetical protein
MKKSKFSEEQIATALRQIDAGAPVLEMTRKLGISESTYYVWRKCYGQMAIAERFPLDNEPSANQTTHRPRKPFEAGQSHYPPFLCLDGIHDIITSLNASHSMNVRISHAHTGDAKGAILKEWCAWPKGDSDNFPFEGIMFVEAEAVGRPVTFVSRFSF